MHVGRSPRCSHWAPPVGCELGCVALLHGGDQGGKQFACDCQDWCLSPLKRIVWKMSDQKQSETQAGHAPRGGVT